MKKYLPKSVIKLMEKDKFLTNVTLIAGGTGFGKLLALLISPILARLYTPEEFGVYGLCLACVVPLTFIVPLGYDLLIPSLKNEEEVFKNFVLGLFFVVLLGSLVSFAFFFFESAISDFFNVHVKAPILWTVGVCAVGGGIYSLLNYLLIREQAYKVISKTRVKQNFSQSALQILVGAAGQTYYGLSIGLLARYYVGILDQVKSVKAFIVRNYEQVSMKDIFWTFKTNIGQTASISLSNVYKYSSPQIPIFILAIYFDMAILGYFSLGARIVISGITVLSKSVSQVYYGELVSIRSAHDHSQYLVLFKKVFRQQAVLGLVILLFCFLSPWIFGWLLGARWSEAGLYMCIMALPLYARFVSASFSTETLLFFGKYKLNNRLELFGTLGQAGLMLLGVYISDSVYVALIGYSLALFTSHLINVLASKRVVESTILGS